MIKMIKMILIILLIQLNLHSVKTNDCSTPLDCYLKAIETLEQDRREMRSNVERLEKKILENQLISDKNNLENKKKIEELENKTKILSGKHSIDRLPEGTGPRSQVYFINFKQPFVKIPNVVIGLSTCDVQNGFRLQIFTEQVSTVGFVIKYFTWADSGVLGCATEWVAFIE